MTFADIPSGASVFVDANVFVYEFAPDPQYGPPCRELMERIELGDLTGVCSTRELSDVAHRLMTLEACQTLGWPYAALVNGSELIPWKSPGSPASGKPWMRSWHSASMFSP